MKKKTDQLSMGETLRLHWRAARDLEKYCPGIAVACVFHAIVKAISPYTTIWFSAQLLNELAGARRPDELLRWVLLTIGITAVMQLLTQLSACWKQNAVNKSLIRQEKIYTD